ncbi:MAG TPA: hypothetical protein VIU29_11370, partial [Candidatus Deferrimicrobiaceae bacterium]
INRQDGSHVAIQVVRYGIVLVPLALAVTAAGLLAAWSDIFGDGSQPRAWLAAIPLGAMLAGFGPFPRTYVAPNNFTNHSAFQYDYAAIDWKQSRVREFFASETRCFPEKELPLFYRIAGNPAPGLPPFRGIVEYPVFIGDHYNYLYYYQHFHRLPVAGGYMQGAVSRFVTTDRQVYGNYAIDDVRGIAAPEAHWRTMVDIGNVGALRAGFAGWVLVVHKDPEQEICAPWSHFDEMAPMVETWDGLFGNRVYEDPKIVCWLIR